MNLEKSQVEFDLFEHKYTLNEKELSGITGVINKHLFPDKYKDVPRHILSNAASRGTEIHELTGLYDLTGIIDGKYQEVAGYAEVIKENKIEIIKSEYLVSDNENYATMIDKVDKDFNLYDIKTTAVLDAEYLSWQLSICAFLFELQNPGLKAGKLYGIWLKNEKSELVEVNKIDKDIVKELLECDKNGKTFVNPFTQITLSDGQLLTKIHEVEQHIILQESELKQLKNKQSEMKKQLIEIMDERGLKSWETDNLKITRRYDSVRKSLDSKGVKNKYPEIYNEFVKETTVKGTVLIKLK